MHVFLIRRLLAAVPVIVVVTVFVFALLHLAPGDPAATRITKSTYLSVVEVSPSRRRASLTK